METDFLVAFPKGSCPQISVRRLEATTRETHLTCVAAQVPRPTGEHDRRTLITVVDRGQDRRRWAAQNMAWFRIADRVDESDDVVDRDSPILRVEVRP